MIAARAKELIALITRLAELRAHVNQLDAFYGREVQLAALLKSFRPLVEAVEQLDRRRIATVEVDERLPGVVSQLRRVQTVYREQRDSFIDAQRSGFGDFERTLKTFFTYLETQVREAWRTYTKARAQPLDPEVLRVLGAIPAYAEAIHRLQQHDRRVTALRESLPTEDVCESFEEAANKRDKIWEELRGADFSDEILKFLRSASAAGATLDAFTPSVERWISNHELRDSFRINMATRGGV